VPDREPTPPPPESIEHVAGPRRRPERHPLVTVATLLSGFLAVMFLGLGAAILLLGLNVSFNFGIEQWGLKKTISLHKAGTVTVLFCLGVWFTLLTRGLWQQQRYGRVMGIVTVVIVVVIAILLKLS
jgi:hypothetical protein